MRINPFLGIGAALAVLGIVGLFLIFPNFMASSGQAFVDQIDTSKGIEEYNDYNRREKYSPKEKKIQKNPRKFQQTQQN